MLTQTLSITSGNGFMLKKISDRLSLWWFARRTLQERDSHVPIIWTVKQGGGQVFNVVAKTDANGYAQADFFGERLIQGESYATSIVNATASFGSVDFVTTTVSTHSIAGAFVGLPQVEMIPPATITGPPGPAGPPRVWHKGEGPGRLRNWTRNSVRWCAHRRPGAGR